jgi:acyl-CoA reductase-like NAD-dependent aldehyde dehydrogenase
MIEIAQRHFPPGVIQAIGGDSNLGPWIVDHPNIPKISFTGSTATGKKINEKAAKHLKRVTLELGGNDAAIVFPDVNMATAAEELANGALRNSGQICFAVKRVYIHESIYDSFLSALVDAVSKLSVGDPTEPNTSLGPIQNKMQYDKLQALRAESESSNHTFVLGESNTTKTFQKGYFIAPTILSKPPPTSSIVVSEQFGPILPCQSWSDLDAVIAEANNTTYGLGASVWTNDLAKAESVAMRLQAGNVWINQHAKPSHEAYVPGFKESALGGEGGVLALTHYCQAKTIYLPKSAC